MEVIDQYDDLGERFSRSELAALATSLLKEASWVERDDLLDRDFALILVDGEGKEHRKFACYDAGSTLVSQWYLLNATHGLPDTAMKVASVNLTRAAQHYGVITDGDLEKAASAPLEGADERRVFLSVAPSRPSTSPSVIRKVASAFDVMTEVTREWADLDPYDRHDAAVDLVKMASLTGATVPDHIFQYSGTELSPRFSKVAQARREFTTREDTREGYLRLSKMAAAMDTEDVVEAMFLLDEQAGVTGRYGARLPDPVLAVYGATKEAEFSWIQGGDYVNERMLKSYSGSSAFNATSGKVFTDAVCDRFKKDPIGTFKAMPPEQQKLMARLASQSRDSNDGGN